MKHAHLFVQTSVAALGLLLAAGPVDAQTGTPAVADPTHTAEGVAPAGTAGEAG